MIFFQILWAFYLDDILILYGYDYSLSNLLIKDFFFLFRKETLCYLTISVAPRVGLLFTLVSS